MKYGITATGFNLKTLENILDEVATEYAAKIGEVNLDDDSVFSQVVRPPMSQLAEAWEAFQAAYLASTLNGTFGIHLDNLIAVNAIARRAATKTRVQAAIGGVNGTTVPAGNQASIDGTGALFEALAEGVVDISNFLQLTVNVNAAANNTLYTVVIGGVTHSITSDSNATVEEIAAALVADINADSVIAEAIDNLDGTFLIRVLDKKTPTYYDAFPSMSATDIYSPQEYQALETGPVLALAGTLTVIENPVSGLDAITNLLDGTTGKAKETDKELLLRRLKVLARAGKATLPAIAAKLISGDVEGVTQVLVYENRTDLTDGEGRPPHSVEAVVVGGDDEEIAKAIYDVVGGGIDTHGNVNGGAGITIEDVQGFDQVIKFSRPVSRYAWIEIDITLDSESDFPADGEAQVEAKVLAFGNANFGIGRNFMLQHFVTPCLEVPGIARVTLRIATTTLPAGSPTYDVTDIAVGPSEVLVFDSARIVFV